MTAPDASRRIRTVLVLNASYEPIQRVSVQHAITMVHRKVAVIEVSEPGRNFGPLPRPAVLRLVRYVATRWRHGRAPGWSRPRLLLRDGRVCGYCERPATTVDHIIPLSRGGASTWLNTVAACHSCNSKKRDRTPPEAGMSLLRQPRIPEWSQVILNGTDLHNTPAVPTPTPLAG